MPEVTEQQNTNAVELVPITVNNKEIQVPKAIAKEAEEVLNTEINTVKNGYDKLLRTEREKLAQEKAKFDADFDKDIKVYNELLSKGVKDLSIYSPLSKGGDGTIREELLPDDDDDSGVTVPIKPRVTATAFEKTEYQKLLERIDAIENIAKKSEESLVNVAISEAQTIAKEFRGSDAYYDAVVRIDMADFHRTHGRPPTVLEIRSMFKDRHSKVAKLDKTPESEPPVPSVKGGKVSGEPKENLPNLFDTKAVSDWIKKKRAGV